MGEIGYVPPAQGESEMRQVSLNEPTLPARHPADRDNTAQSPSSSNPSSSTETTTAATTNGEAQPKKIRSWTFGGIHISSFLRLLLLLGLMAGTAGAWWYTVKHLQDSMATSQSMTTDQSPVTGGWSSTIFVHVAFSVVALFEFIFLERTIFHMRAERYMFKHGMSPDARRAARRAATLGIAPWNRLPLPTYAAALAEGGHGTGDVEDNLIAIVPPPAYGNTRGSVLLLSSMLPSNLIRSLSRVSQRSERSTRSRGREAEMEDGRRRGRPLSYGASEEVDDAARARQLEASLARLENQPRPQPTASTSSNP